MASMTAKMEALLVQHRTSGGGQHQGNQRPQILSLSRQNLWAYQLLSGEYNQELLLSRTCFQHILQEIHLRPSLTLCTANILQDSMMSALSLTMIVYIVDMVTRQV